MGHHYLLTGIIVQDGVFGAELAQVTTEEREFLGGDGFPDEFDVVPDFPQFFIDDTDLTFGQPDSLGTEENLVVCSLIGV